MQALTKSKVVELEALLDENTILFMTETHEKYRKVDMNENIEVIESMRDVSKW